MRQNAVAEQDRAEAFAAVMRRATPDWAAYGFTDQEQQQWERQGVPADKAHWAAILRDLNELMQFKVGTRSQLAGDANVPATVLEALEQGKPAARICQLLAKQRGVADPTPTAVRSVINPRTVRVAAHHWDRSVLPPKGMGALLNAMAARARDELYALKPFEELRSEAAAHLQAPEEAPGALLAAAAQSYGVYAAGGELDQLAACWADLGSQIARNELSARVFENINQDRHMYFLLPPCASDIHHGGVVHVPAEHELPSPTGLAWLAGDGEQRPPQVLAWVCARGEITVVWSTVESLLERLERDKITTSKGVVARYRYADGTAEALGGVAGGTTAIGLLARFSELFRSREIAPVTGAVTVASPSSRPRAEREAIVIRYRPGHHSAAGSRVVSAAYEFSDIRWKVRGHWRNQWYPSERVHRPLWIEEHDAGHSPRGEVVTRDIITRL